MSRTVLEQLKHQVLARPDDLSARRVYADALLEAGDPLGEFITLQCDLESAAGARREELERRATSLLDRYAAHWLQTLTRSDRAAVRFTRGFVEHWACGARGWWRARRCGASRSSTRMAGTCGTSRRCRPSPHSRR
ncbi:MAG: TIGR02996 domain-containing protein [Myxococcota bacterium]